MLVQVCVAVSFSFPSRYLALPFNCAPVMSPPPRFYPFVCGSVFPFPVSVHLRLCGRLWLWAGSSQAACTPSSAARSGSDRCSSRFVYFSVPFLVPLCLCVRSPARHILSVLNSPPTHMHTECYQHTTHTDVLLPVDCVRGELPHLLCGSLVRVVPCDPLRIDRLRHSHKRHACPHSPPKCCNPHDTRRRASSR